MFSDDSKIKLAALGTFAVLIGLAAAIVLSGLQQLTPTFGTALSGLTSPSQPHQVSTSSFTTSPSGSTGSTESAASTSDTTTNWAGYVSTGGTYTSVSGSWKVPNVTASDDPLAADATWIGIGGDSSDDLIQIGTQNMVESGQVTTGTFYERLPETSETVPGVNVNAGDTVTASVKEVASGEWTINIADLTNGESYTNTVAYNSSESSAEWIEEAPSADTGVMPLDSFGSVTFTDGLTTENGSTRSIATSNAQAVTMDNEANQALTSTSVLNSGGDGFTVSRTSASSDASSYGQFTTIPSGGWTRHEPGRDAWGYGQGSAYSQPDVYRYYYR